MSDIETFVEQKLGKNVLLNLKKIHIGGLNNQKGRDYENFFQLFKSFELASQDINHSKHILSCQELAFIDDICHWDLENSVKHNFQAKNSSGSAADWTAEITQRCKRQILLDKGFHKVQESKNYLLVSCNKKCTNNLNKIPATLRKGNTCIFFPYHKTLLELIENTRLKDYIINLIATNDISQIDYAATLILGVLQSGEHLNIQKLFEKACSNAMPNPFIKFRNNLSNKQQEAPNWLKELVSNSSHNTIYRLESNRVYLSLESGLEVSALLDSILQLSEPQIQKIITVKDLAILFISLTSQELDTTIDFSPLKGA